MLIATLIVLVLLNLFVGFFTLVFFDLLKDRKETLAEIKKETSNDIKDAFERWKSL